jgi:hypothetical protein
VASISGVASISDVSSISGVAVPSFARLFGLAAAGRSRFSGFRNASCRGALHANRRVATMGGMTAPLDPTDDPLEDALEAQQMLLENSLPAAVEAYRDGQRRGLPVPVVFVVDCEDAIGSRIVRAWLGDDAVDDAIAQQHAARHGDEETTVFAWAFSWEEACQETPRMFPYLDPVFERPPSQGFLAIAVTAGGASALTVPPEAWE